MVDIDISEPGGDSGSGAGPPEPSLPYFFGTRLAGLLVVLAVVYLTRPLWHGFVYSMLYSPSSLVLTGGAVVTALVLWFLPPWWLGRDTPLAPLIDLLFGSDGPAADSPISGDSTSQRKLRVFAVVFGVLFALSIVVGIPAGALEQRSLADRTMSEATELETFPQANPDNPRVVPREVSDISTRGSVSYRQHRLGESDIARQEDGSLAWSYSIQPDGPRNKLLENQRGVLVANMTAIDDRQTTAYDDDEFRYGLGMYLQRSADWQLKKTDYLARYDDDAVEFTKDGTPYMYFPKTEHEWKLFPFPHTVPAWDGGALVHPDGTIEHLSPAEAQDHEILDGQRLYPLTLTRTEVESLGYREGIVNQLPVVGAHEGEIEVAGLPQGASNEQPFVIDLEGERLSYVTAMEPFGLDSRGLDEVWFADAETGEYTYFGTDDETLTGPERAMGIARSADSQTNWGENFVVTEPVPVTIDGALWWQIKVSPTDFTDVTRNVFVNADTGEAVEIRGDSGVRSFIAGDIDAGAPDDGSGGNATDGGGDETGENSDIAYVILITDDDGNVVDRVEVEQGQDTRIVNSGNRTATPQP